MNRGENTRLDSERKAAAAAWREEEEKRVEITKEDKDRTKDIGPKGDIPETLQYCTTKSTVLVLIVLWSPVPIFIFLLSLETVNLVQ